MKTIIQELGSYKGNKLWIKREDLLPFSFGGNKARKVELFFKEVDAGKYDCIVTYGSSSSNLCRIVANQCCKREMPCIIISPEESSGLTFNSQLMDIFDAKILTVPVSDVHDAIEDKMIELRSNGMKPYFIEGGGHGNIGTEAYVQCYDEIREYEKNENVHFDYIFFASGTGTTQAGLVCGQLINNDDRQIVGISIARKNPRGREVVLNSIRSYLGNNIEDKKIQTATVFIDDYTDGYGKEDIRVKGIIEFMMKKYGIPMDATYTGKAFMGMSEYIDRIKDKNILFIHTGGVPLFFDELKRRQRG